jgi:hypothetical protein
MKNNIEYSYYHWGPYLWKTQLPKEFCNELLARGYKLTESHNTKLASDIDNVKNFKENDLHWLAENLTPYFVAYLESKEEYQDRINEFKSLEMTSAWINFQHQYENNPLHTHNHSYSFVIYLQVPEEIREENLKYKGTHKGPGCIEFRYGEQMDDSVNLHSFMPQEGEMFMFPARLAHWVVPFRSDCIRISVSGNLLKLK